MEVAQSALVGLPRFTILLEVYPPIVDVGSVRGICSAV